MEGGRKTGRGREGGERREREGVMQRAVAVMGGRRKESLAGRDTAEGDEKQSGQEGEVWRGCRQIRYKTEDGIYGVKNVDDLYSDALAIAFPQACS